MKSSSCKSPDSKVHGANMGPIWGRQDPGGPHVGPMNFAIWEIMERGHYLVIATTTPVILSDPYDLLRMGFWISQHVYADGNVMSTEQIQIFS